MYLEHCINIPVSYSHNCTQNNTRFLLPSFLYNYCYSWAIWSSVLYFAEFHLILSFLLNRQKWKSDYRVITKPMITVFLSIFHFFMSWLPNPFYFIYSTLNKIRCRTRGVNHRFLEIDCFRLKAPLSPIDWRVQSSELSCVLGVTIFTRSTFWYLILNFG